MNLSIEVVSAVLESLTIFAGILIIIIFVNKIALHNRINLFQKTKQYLVYKYIDQDFIQKTYNKKFLLKAYIALLEQISIDDSIKVRISQDFKEMKILKRYEHNLHSFSVRRRKQAVYILGYFLDSKIKVLLLECLRKESKESIKLYIAYALKNDLGQETLFPIVNSLIGSSMQYRYRIHALINQYFHECGELIQTLLESKQIEIKDFVLSFASTHHHPMLHRYLKDELNRVELFLAKKGGFEQYLDPTKVSIKQYHLLILKALSSVYEDDDTILQYQNHESEDIQKLIIDTYAKKPGIKAVEKIISNSNGTILDEYRKEVIFSMMESNPDMYMELLQLFHVTQKDDARKLIASLLSFKTDYLILKLTSTKRQLIVKTIKEIVEYGFVAELIRFMNQNKNIQIEHDLNQIIMPIILVNDFVQVEFKLYLDEPILLRMGLLKKELKATSPSISRLEQKKIRWLMRILIGTIIFFPVVFILRYYEIFGSRSMIDLIIIYVVDINYYLVYYYVAVNIIYIILIILSYIGSKEQSFEWSLKPKTMLFEKGMLSTISIIAPAYNEELSIVDSIHSLLNLNYPKYEVIVVNDGSKDLTLQRLISHFQLERKNNNVHSLIQTKYIRGIYRNKHIPNLTVVDKENGGKADALNVGINVARYDYICGIDADSMLESDSLLRLMSVTLDKPEKTIALGGNIYPANGCLIDRGVVEEKGLSSSMLARLQSIEYLRAFTSGRIGWAKLRTLLIVSGAFGLFDRMMLIDAGGYLSVSGVHKKHTVGEDMELVVRLARVALEKKIKHRIDYVYHANCFTEVPTDLVSLLKQRNRWHRGLIDILSYHRKLIFHPHYKQVGMIGLPYFTVFEMIGPLFEVQGYLMLIISLLFGLLNIPILLAIFTVTVMLGIIVSLMSLFVTERDSQYLGVKDTLILIIYAVFENFGYRQLISLYRVVGFFSSLRETGAWGAMVRKGFKK